jgi:starch synthase
MPRPLRIVMVSAEVESLARTGGLGDVVFALSHALAALGAEVLVVTPLYGVTTLSVPAASWHDPVFVRVGEAERVARVVELPRHTRPGGGYVRTCLLDVPELFGRDGIYGDANGTFGDNDVRFATLSRGALEVSARVFGEPGRGEGPDVVHAHDWHAAPAVLYARTIMGDAWARTPSVFTLHNLAFQGLYGPDALARLGLPSGLFHPEVGEQLGAFNLVKAATSLATHVTTVSPNHAREILTLEGGFGLDAHLRAHAGKITGIVNGIDEARFDPGLDPDLVRRYDLGSFVSGRAACKSAFTEELGISSDGPLFGMVSRLTWQKGVDLFLDVLEALVDRGASAAIVGRGDADLESAVEEASRRHPGRVASRITFDGALARRLYSASDFVMVPSRFEPCGLTQLYGMRYGALPIVTRVGGLLDTVTPMDTANATGTGFLAERAEVRELLVACDDALVLYGDATGRHAAVDRAMSRDSSWTASARTYLELFRSLR